MKIKKLYSLALFQVQSLIFYCQDNSCIMLFLMSRSELDLGGIWTLDGIEHSQYSLLLYQLCHLSRLPKHIVNFVQVALGERVCWKVQLFVRLQARLFSKRTVVQFLNPSQFFIPKFLPLKFTPNVLSSSNYAGQILLLRFCC